MISRYSKCTLTNNYTFHPCPGVPERYMHARWNRSMKNPALEVFFLILSPLQFWDRNFCQTCDWKSFQKDENQKKIFSNQKVISHAMPPISDIIFTFPHILFLPTELLSACHELRCRYGCVMTRNGTFCFCADGFEVGEDGTSCRGKIQWRWRGPLLSRSSPLAPLRPRPDFHQK